MNNPLIPRGVVIIGGRELLNVMLYIALLNCFS